MLSRFLAPVRLRVLSTVLVAGLGLAGCASQTAYDNSLSPAQNQLRQANARFNQTVGEGAVAGAVVGGLAGLALGGRNRAQAAAIGAAGGAALGAGAGYLVARNNLSRSSTEAQYADAIQQASADADKYRTYASISRQIADEATAEASRLNGQLRAGQITQAQYRSGISKYQADIETLRQQASAASQTAAAMRQDARVASGANRGQLNSLANSTDSARVEIEQNLARYSRTVGSAA